MCSVVGLIWRHAVKAGVRAAAIVEIEIPSDRGTCVWYAVVAVQIDLLVLHCPPEPLDEHVVPPRALPSMLIAISFLMSTPVKSVPVNWAP